jgi:hypothetical protein
MAEPKCPECNLTVRLFLLGFYEFIIYYIFLC